MSAFFLNPLSCLEVEEFQRAAMTQQCRFQDQIRLRRIAHLLLAHYTFDLPHSPPLTIGPHHRQQFRTVVLDVIISGEARSAISQSSGAGASIDFAGSGVPA
jgi:hypothetical protein